MEPAKSKPFTDKYIKSLKPKEGQTKFYDIREKSGKGFGITVHPSGKIAFIFIYHFIGRKRRMTLGQYPNCSLAEARALHHDALKILHSGKDPGLEKKNEKAKNRDASTVEGLIDEYLEMWAKPRKRSWKEDERILSKDIRSVWGKRKAKDITRRDIILLLDKIKERGAPIIANRTLACIRRMFNFGIERDIITHNPCLAVKAPAKENRRDRNLSFDEIKSFWNTLEHSPMAELCRLALKLQLTTAQRKGEIVSAEWNEIDFSTKFWTIPATKAKNGISHRVPLSTLAIELLGSIKKFSGHSRWLFPSPKNDKPILETTLDKAIRRTAFDNIPHFTPHDLRRTAASQMTAIGVSRLVVSKILNHVDNTVTGIYDRHSYDTEKHIALEAWGEKLKDLIYEHKAENNIILLTSML